jgi:hypothetical protein
MCEFGVGGCGADAAATQAMSAITPMVDRSAGSFGPPSPGCDVEIRP